MFQDCSHNKNTVVTPITKAIFSVEIGKIGLVKFLNNSSNSNKYLWDFGKGNTSNLENPSFVNSSNGTKIVKLISSNSSSIDSTKKSIEIKNIPSFQVNSLDKDFVFICDNDGSCKLLASKSGTVIWEFKTEEYIISSPTYSNGKFIISTFNYNYSKIFALDFLTGKLVWEFKAIQSTASPLVIDGYLYAMSFGKFYCLNTTTGKMVWEIESKEYYDSSPTYHNGLIYFMSKEGLEIIDSKNGKITKRIKARKANSKEVYSPNGLFAWQSSPAICNEICYFVFNNLLQSYNLKTEQTKTEYKFIEYNSSFYPSPTIDNGYLSVKNSNFLFVFDVETLNVIWSKENISKIESCSFINNDEIYTTNYVESKGNFGTGEVLCYDIKTGKEKWKKQFGDYRGYNSSINYFDSIIYVASTVELIAINSKDGTLLWRSPLKGQALG